MQCLTNLAGRTIKTISEGVETLKREPRRVGSPVRDDRWPETLSQGILSTWAYMNITTYKRFICLSRTRQRKTSQRPGKKRFGEFEYTAWVLQLMLCKFRSRMLRRSAWLVRWAYVKRFHSSINNSEEGVQVKKKQISATEMPGRIDWVVVAEQIVGIWRSNTTNLTKAVILWQQPSREKEREEQQVGPEITRSC